MKLSIKAVWLSALLCTVLCGCGGLMPAGAGFGAGRNGGSGRDKRPLAPEHLVYQIDDHRYITISGGKGCEGGMFYYDSQLGIRTNVAYTGFSLGDGVAKGRYAIDSTYIAIPVLDWSDYSGVMMDIYYSYDLGRTFHKIIYGGEPREEAKVSVKGDYLYIYGNRFGASKFDISHKVPTDEFGQLIDRFGDDVDPATVPQDIQSPSGIERMSCGAPIVRPAAAHNK